MSTNIEWALPLPTAKVFSANFLAVPIPPRFSPAKVLCSILLMVGDNACDTHDHHNAFPQSITM